MFKYYKHTYYFLMIPTRHIFAFITLLSILLFSSCKTHRAVTGATSVHHSDSARFDSEVARMIQRANENRIPYDWFAARIRVEFSDSQQSQDFTAVVRMRHDSILWMSLQGPFGIEGARILVTRDTIRLVNKLSGEYLCQPISYLASILPMQTDMAMLQDFILGYFMQFRGAIPDYRGMEDSLHMIQTESPQMRYRAQLYPQNYTLAKTLLTDKMVRQEMSITFDGYTTEQGHPFSAVRTIDLRQGNKAYNLHLTYSKVRINEPLAFPFEIDPGMKKVDNIRF